ncbi:WD40 repeat domain-containing protein [Streptomyces sp. NPDC090088]|uniref:WD40 repeat domain-containing protein n=1 Tax=Streptomyces sp. NPDC090088 TaxID=3365944 RepID=UPI00381E3F00
MTVPSDERQLVAAAMLDGLLDSIRSARSARPRWDAAEPYLLRHAMTHAVAAGQVDVLLTDLEFLVHADPETVLPALDLAASPQARTLAAVYRVSAGKHSRVTAQVRRHLLSLDAARLGLLRESRRLLAPQRVPLALWSPSWSTASQADPALVRTTEETAWVEAVAIAAIDTRPVIAVAVADEILLRDMATGEPIGLPLRGHTDTIRALHAANVDGRPTLCSAGDDGTARLWDLRSAEPVPFAPSLADGPEPRPGVTAVALTDIDGRATLLAGGEDGILRLWDLATGRVRECTGHGRRISDIAVGIADGVPIAATASWDDTVRIWQLHDATTLAVLSGHSTWVNAVTIAATPERTTVISAGNDDTVRLWDAATGAAILVIGSPISTIRSVSAISTDRGLALAGAGVSGALCWWDLSPSEIRPRVMTGHTESVSAVRIGHFLGTPLIVTGGADRSVRTWDPTISSGRATSIASGQRHDTDITAVALTTIDSEELVASGDEHGTLCLWRLSDGTPIASFSAHDLGAAPPAEFGAEGPDIFALTSVDLRGVPTMLIGRADGSLTILDLATSRVAHIINAHTGPVSALTTCTVDERVLLFSAGDDAIIRVHDLETGEPTATLEGHTDFINALVNLGEDMIASGSNDGTIRVWRASDGAPLGPPLHTDEYTINCLAVLNGLDPDHAGPFVAGAGDDGRIQIWDVPTGRLVRTLRASREPINSITTVTAVDGPVLVSGGDDSKLQTWDPAEASLLDVKPLPARIRALHSRDGLLVACFGWEVATLRY